MLKRKKAFLVLIPLSTIMLLLVTTLIYLLFIKIPGLNTDISQLNSKLESVMSDVKNKDDVNKSLESELGDINKAKANLESRIKTNEAALSKQQACTKANELSQIPSDLSLRSDGESGGNGCSNSRVGFLPSSTQGVLEYLQGLMKNYQDTNRWLWQHSPEVCKYDAEKAIPILEKRYADYQKYKNLCGS